MNPKDTDKIVDAWWNERIRGSGIARHTEAWNLLLPEVEDLKRRLRGDPEPKKKDA